MPKAKKGAPRRSHRSTPSSSPGPGARFPSEEEPNQSVEDFYQACTDGALWALGKLVDFSILAYGATAICAVFAYGSAIRGARSLAVLGTVAILLLPWTAVVSSGAVLVSKLGWTTLIFLVALAFGLFRCFGTMAGILALGLYSIVALFLGGSPWLTTLVTVAGCTLFYFRYTALALIGTLCYAALSVYRMGGLFALFATFLAACLSNDVIQYLAVKLPPEKQAPEPEGAKEGANTGRSREWSWKDTTGGSGWGSGNSGQQSSRDNFYNSTYGGGRGDGTSGRGRGDPSGRGDASGRGTGGRTSTSGSSYSYGGSGKPHREREASDSSAKSKRDAPKSERRESPKSPNGDSSGARWQNGGPPNGGYPEQDKKTEKEEPGIPRTASYAEDLGDAEAEVTRIMACSSHWAVMGLTRGASVDIAEAKRTYHKKARLVHPDKNGGCANAGEAFKCLQAAYETLIDPVKRKDYEEELRAKDMGARFHKMAEDAKSRQGANGKSRGTPSTGFDPEEMFRENDSKKVHCYHCGDSHEWLKVDRPKNRCRWCTDCNRYHGAAEGDGWFEQASKPMFFGLFKTDEPMQAFCVEGGQVYLCTSWVECQGMVGRPNTHKPSFEVKSEGRGRGGGGGGRGGGRGRSRGKEPGKEPDLSDCFESEEDFWHFMEDVMRQGGGSPGPRSHSAGRGPGGKPKTSKKQRQKAKRNGW